MGLGLQNAMGARAASNALQAQIEREFLNELKLRAAALQEKELSERSRIADAGLAQRATEFNAELPLKTGALDVSRGNLDVNRGELDLKRLAYEKGAPQRIADVALTEAQTQAMLTQRLPGLFSRRNPDGSVTRVRDEEGVVSAPEPRTPTVPQSEPLESVIGPDGKTILMPRSRAAGMTPSTGQKPITGMERTAVNYFNRAKEALATAEPLEEQIAQMGFPGQLGMQYLPNWLQSQTGQSYRQAQRAFTEARLRKESGAAIPPTEFENDAKIYFAQPGDTPETIAQKRAARQEVLDGLGFAGGRAYEEFYGEPFQRKAPSGGGQSTGGTVKMRAPDGTVSDVPAALVKHYESLGAKVVR